MQISNIPEAFSLSIRLKLISCLLNGEKTFKELKQITKATDGNIISVCNYPNWKNGDILNRKKLYAEKDLKQVIR